MNKTRKWSLLYILVALIALPLVSAPLLPNPIQAQDIFSGSGSVH